MTEVIEPNLIELQYLLAQIGEITKRHEEIALASGEKFNVFDIIGIKNKEVTLHSAMLAELLNAKGSHGMKGKFLELFIGVMKAKNESFNNPFTDINQTNSKAEKYAGTLSQDEGGRIDLYISDNANNAIIIENKIYAGEQEKQLIRYRNFNKNAPIIFLTIDGHKPQSISFEDENRVEKTIENYFCMSYKEDMINWLDLASHNVFN